MTDRSRIIRRVGDVAWTCAALMVTACAGRAPEPPSPMDSDDISRRHWDQACQPARSSAGPMKITELFDTVGLGADLEREGLRPQARVGEAPRVDFIARYLADGQVLATGLWEASVQPERLSIGGD